MNIKTGAERSPCFLWCQFVRALYSDMYPGGLVPFVAVDGGAIDAVMSYDFSIAKPESLVYHAAHARAAALCGI